MNTSNRLVASVEALASVHPADNRYSLRRFGIQIRGGRMIRGARIEDRREKMERVREGDAKRERERSLTLVLSICRSTRLSRDNGTCAMAQ